VAVVLVQRQQMVPYTIRWLSLIERCHAKKKNLSNPAKIVADGGFRKFPDIIKAIALGADYVMLGGIVNKSLESCSPCYVYNDKMEEFEKVSLEDAKVFMKNNQDVYKYFRGMSTKEVQAKWGKSRLKTAEGITKYNKVEYTIEGWIENFSDYLKSNMSYCNKRTLDDYSGNVDVRFITSEAYARFNK
jgi:IMP dehydrogenase